MSGFCGMNDLTKMQAVDSSPFSNETCPREGSFFVLSFAVSSVPRTILWTYTVLHIHLFNKSCACILDGDSVQTEPNQGAGTRFI